jgi:hypothetical protein
VVFTPVAVPPPDWWAEALISLDEGDDIKLPQDPNEQLRHENEVLKAKNRELEARLSQYENAKSPSSQKPGSNRKKDRSSKGKKGTKR